MRYKNLEAEIARTGLSIEEVGHKLGFGKSLMYNRLAGRTKWTLSDMLEIQKFINDATGSHYTLDYLFAKG